MSDPRTVRTGMGFAFRGIGRRVVPGLALLLVVVGADLAGSLGGLRRAAGQDGEPPAASQVAIQIEARLVDGTRWLVEQRATSRPASPHGGARGTPPIDPATLALTGATVRATITPPGSDETTQQDVEIDAEGHLHADLGRWPVGSRLQFMGRVGSTVYLAEPIEVGSSIEDVLPMYRVGEDHAAVEQSLIRIVTWQGTAEDPWVHVRQITTFSNTRGEITLEPTLEQAVALFPLPPGAELLTLTSPGRVELERPPREVPGWGFGVPVIGLLYPETTLIGTYRVPAGAGDRFSLDLESPLRTRAYTMTLEIGRFRYDPTGEGNQPPLVAGSVLRPGDVQQSSRPWSLPAGLPAGERLDAEVTVLGGDPGTPPAIEQRLDCRLVDATELFTSSHGGQMPAAEPRALANVDVRVAQAGGGSRELLASGRTGPDGELDLTLPPLPLGRHIELFAGSPPAVYQSLPLMVGEDPEPRFFMFRTARDPYSFQQSLTRVVTEQVSVTDQQRSVHVRQIQLVVHGGFEIVPAPASLDEAPVFFPVPRGATVQDLTVDGVALAVAEPREHPGWGYGVPLRIAVTPRQHTIMGTYTVPVEEGGTVDLGFQAPVTTRGLRGAQGTGAGVVIAVEAERFHYRTPADGTGPALQDGGDAGRVPGVERSMHQFGLEALPASEPLVAEFRYGRAPMNMKTVAYLAGLLLLLGFAWFVGSTLSRARGGRAAARSPEQLLAELASLDEQLARGEIDAATHAERQAELTRQLRRETAGTSAPAPTSPPAPSPTSGGSGRAVVTLSAGLPEVERLRALSAERDRSPEELERDAAELRATVRRLLGEDGGAGS